MKRIIFFLILVVGSARLEAHAFLKHADPGVGSTLRTENIEPAVSNIQVFDASGKEVDKRDLHLDSSDHALLQVSLPPLGAGTYQVSWRVVSVDTHVTSGSFRFRVVR